MPPTPSTTSPGRTAPLASAAEPDSMYEMTGDISVHLYRTMPSDSPGRGLGTSTASLVVARKPAGRHAPLAFGRRRTTRSTSPAAAASISYARSHDAGSLPPMERSTSSGRSRPLAAAAEPCARQAMAMEPVPPSETKPRPSGSPGAGRCKRTRTAPSLATSTAAADAPRPCAMGCLAAAEAPGRAKETLRLSFVLRRVADTLSRLASTCDQSSDKSLRHACSMPLSEAVRTYLPSITLMWRNGTPGWPSTLHASRAPSRSGSSSHPRTVPSSMPPYTRCCSTTREHTWDPVASVSVVSKEERRVSQKQRKRPIDAEMRMRPAETRAQVAPYESTLRTRCPSASTSGSDCSLVEERLHTESDESFSPAKRSASGKHDASIDDEGHTNLERALERMSERLCTAMALICEVDLSVQRSATGASGLRSHKPMRPSRSAEMSVSRYTSSAVIATLCEPRNPVSTSAALELPDRCSCSMTETRSPLSMPRYACAR
mmetsp:Transcript_1417/g.4479  ORF Transcript_1417/g.4479 Transcript_1417/m.4479 type:complete len:490 (-) Transcript_1417:475-1944(-)